jgi:hypothetical protein
VSAPTFDQAAAARLRAICDRLGLSAFVPADDAKLMEAQFAVFGMIRGEIDALLNKGRTTAPANAYDLSKSVKHHG